MNKNISNALSSLDPQNDNHWTQDGLPRLDTIKILAGDPSLTREQVTAAAPDFNRTAAQAAVGGAAGATATPVQGGGEQGAQGGAGAAPGAVPPAPPAPPAPPESDLPQLNPVPLAQEGGNEELEQQIKEAELQLSDALDRANLAKQEVSDAQNRVAKLTAQLKDLPKASGNTITEYLKRQQKNLEERAARKKLIQESGLDLKALAKDLKSPLDAAMERRAGRGNSRPVRG